MIKENRNLILIKINRLTLYTVLFKDIKCDFKKELEVTALVNSIDNLNIDVLINNAYTGVAIKTYFHKIDEQDFLDRVIANEQIKQLNKKFAIAGRRARVKDFQYFVNEGYLGLYNSITTEIKQRRGVPIKADLASYMGVPELAANIFRLSLTSERPKMFKNPS